ncbi:MAG: hypothetical protein K0Q55_1223 [Verrucomicrobia bacterium]|jgi:hypothetical protein|nr:hypothetical protein [Verrucomicrobiota bacterium]
MHLRWLRLALSFAALIWGAAGVGILLSWPAAEAVLQQLGAQPIAYDRMLDYWLRMTAGAFGLIGCGFLGLAISPRKFANVLPWAGALMLVEGLILLVHGMRLSLPPLPFYADTAACLLDGTAIIYLARRLERTRVPA